MTLSTTIPPRRASAMAAVLLATVLTNPVRAADLGGDCCADLEERIAELEATTARKGNRRVSLTVTGHVNQSVLFWDDGNDNDAYVVGNKNDQSHFDLQGNSDINADWSTGFQITVRLKDTLSDEVDQTNDDGSGEIFQLWETYVFLENRTLGRISLGLVSRATDTAPEHDLSETGSGPAYAGVQDLGGGFFLRRSDNALSGIAWGDLYSHLNGDTANVIRYDTPEFAGFFVSVSWGEDDVWDAGLSYSGILGSILIEGSIAFTELTDANGLDGTGEVDNSTLVGSLAVLHGPSGLNALVTLCHRAFDATVMDADNVERTPGDAFHFYTKIGWISDGMTTLGPTAFYGEYGRFDDFATAGTDPTTLAAVAGTAARVASSKAEVLGLGVVQHIDAASMQVYFGYRHHEAEFDLINAAGGGVATTGLEDFQTIIVGSLISF